MNGLTRLDGLTSANWILSIALAREVACLAFEALAAKRLTEACSSQTYAFLLALSASSCSRDWGCDEHTLCAAYCSRKARA